ncbi:Rab-like protein 6 [Tritrichomonas musculus]|uniref:Rab-like protein 6 n=1 Tax=Tritrichomonas musculus TaxID=1915356 RepID=A0ABR2JW11_9EUKA
MGSEDSIPISETGSHSNLPAFTKRTPQNSSTRHDYELLIVIRGQRNTGKTSLVQRMQGLPFSNDYTPTKTLSAAEFIWSSPKSEKVRITLWDVVERALLPSDLDEKIEYPDATTVDTYKRADGLVIMIDTRYPDTIKLATQVLRDAPDHIPIVVFSNFQDANDAVPTIPKPIKQYIERFSFIAGSMKSNLGLDGLNRWLSLPLAKSKSTLYLNKYKSLMESLNQKILDFTTTAEYYVDLETALSRMPKPTLIGNPKNSQNSQQQQQQQHNQTQRRLSEMNIAKDDNDFWSDDDEDEINKQIQRKIDSNKPQENPKGEELFVSNPMVKRRVIKKPQNASPPGQNKSDEIKDNENEQSQNKTSNIKYPTPNVQPQIKIDGGDVDDDFFNDDDENEAKIPQNVNLRVLEEEDDEPLRPNPLVASSKSKVPAKPQVQVKKQNEETKTENEIKEPEKPIIPTIKVEDEDNGFFDNDDAENEEDVQSAELDKEGSDEEQLKPNPLVSAKPVPNTKPVIQNKVAANVTASSEAEKENKESQKQEEPAIPTIKVENEDNGFFDDDNEDNEQDMKADELNKEDSDDEPLKPNPLVSSKPVPNTKPAPTVTANETQNEAKNEDKEPEKQVEPAIPTIEVENEDNGFFDDDENEQEVNDIDNNNDDNDEEQLKPNPLVSSKPVPNANQAIVATNEEEQKKEEEASIPQQQNLAEEPNAQVSLPTIDAGKVDDDFFNDDENENEKPQDAIENVVSNESVNNEEKVDDGFFDDEDEANNDNDGQQQAISNNDDEDEDEVIKPNPLVATNIKSKLQNSLAQQQEKELQEQQQQQEQRQELEQQHSPSIIPDIQQNEEVDDFFNDDDQEKNQNDEAANSNTDDYAEINEDSKPKVAKRKLVKKKRTKRQKQDDDADAAPPQVSGDYESI